MSGKSVAARFGAVLMALLFITALAVPPSTAATIMPGAPVLTGLVAESGPSASPGDTIVFRWTAVDEAGVPSGYFNLKSDSDPSWYKPIYIIESTRLADGSWTGTISLPLTDSSLPSGTLYISEGYLSDGRASSWYTFPSDMASPTVEVTGTEYHLGPRIKDVSFSPSSSEPGKPITVRVRAEDLQGIRSFGLTIKGPHFHHYVYEDVQARNVGNNLWEWDHTFTTDAGTLEPGTYWVADLNLVDNSGVMHYSSSFDHYPEETSPFTFTIVDPAEYQTASPTISGINQVPHTLTADPGVWGPGPVSLSYQWMWIVHPSLANSPAVPIEGATAPTHKLEYARSGEDLQVHVTGTWPDGTQRTRRSASITEVRYGNLDEFGPHTLTLTGPGETETWLRAEISGSWPTGTGFTFRLYADGVQLPQWQDIYLTKELLGKTIEARVKVHAPGYSDKTMVSEPVVVKLPRPAQKDLNGDGRPDILARDAAGALWYYAGAWNNTMGARVKIGSGWNSMTSILMPGDFDGDRKADVIARDTAGALWLYPGNGAGRLQARQQIGSGWRSMTALATPGDFNGDTIPDLISSDAGGRLFLYPGNGTGGFTSRLHIGTGWNSMNAIVGVGDFNGDKKSDLHARDSSGQLWLYPGNGKGGFTSRSRIGVGWNSMSGLTGPGLFGNDSAADLLARDSSGRLWTYPGNGSGQFWPREPVGTGWNIYTLVVP
ncbi:FG-GAP repeat domain-containing protein [Arthrobacter tumbae]|uniref:FG-GAP repeat domain-containing protein n=1 Tax=Arthrobacter tumbae TaxID=163874 RepID=UPI001958A65A|nr:VCBS repeat-containing protein [Arthrobacter tumbae]MBM7781060.1 hypothetical protein [Arthrobacter tumbae]